MLDLEINCRSFILFYFLLSRQISVNFDNRSEILIIMYDRLQLDS